MIEPIDVLQALLFASDAPVEAGTIQDVLDLPSIDTARELVTALRARLDQQGALQVIEAGGGFRLVTRPEVAPWLVRLARSKTRSRLSRPALETLAIIAYRQPVSRPEVDATRGVNSEAVLDNLLERRLIRITGRKDSAGRPFLYETTREFLVAFGLRDLGDLPKIDGDLVVVDPAAATAAPAESADPATSADAASGGAEADGDEIDTTSTGSRVILAEDVVDASSATGGTETAESVDAVGAIDTDHEGGIAGAIETTDVSGEHRAVDTEDASTAEYPPQQDPRAGGPDVAPRS